MTRTSDGALIGAGDRAEPAPDTGYAGAPPAPKSGTARVLVVDAEPSLAGLLDEWLGAAGCRVAEACGNEVAVAGERYDLVIVDVPFPRRGGVDLIARITKRHPMTPILALSPSFFAGIDCCGAVARTLGVAGVCPWPVSREALIDAVRRFLPS